MTNNDARVAILNRIALAGLPTDLGGANIDATVPSTSTVWIRPTIKFNTGRVESIGGARRSRSGVVIIQVFTPIDSGQGDSDDAANTLVLLFESQSDPGGLRYYNVGQRDIGRVGQWWQSSVTLDFEYDVACV